MCDSSEHKKVEEHHVGGTAEEGHGSLGEASTGCVLQQRDVKLEAAGKALWWLPGSTGYGTMGLWAAPSQSPPPVCLTLMFHYCLASLYLWRGPQFNVPLCYIILCIIKDALRIIRTAFLLWGFLILVLVLCNSHMSCTLPFSGYENIGATLLPPSRIMSSLNSSPRPPCCLSALDCEEFEFLFHLVSLSANTLLPSTHPFLCLIFL